MHCVDAAAVTAAAGKRREAALSNTHAHGGSWRSFIQVVDLGDRHNYMSGSGKTQDWKITDKLILHGWKNDRTGQWAGHQSSGRQTMHSWGNRRVGDKPAGRQPTWHVG